MKLTSHQKLIPFSIINAFLFISTIIVTIVTLSFGTVAGQVDTGTTEGWFYIATFTVDSNILLGIVAFISLILALNSLSSKKPLPKIIPTLYLIATATTVLTFLTVLLYLAPIRALNGRNYFDMFLGPMFFFHFFNPVIAVINLIFFTDGDKLTLKSRLLSLLPFLIYAIPYCINVVFLKTWPDFYGVTFGGQYIFLPLVLLLFSSIIFIISSFLAYCHNRRLALK